MKPIGRKNYGSIPHLIGSKTGPGDKTVHEGQHRICTEKVRDKHDMIIIQEKYDGSNVGIAKKNGKILALTRSGYLAHTSPYEQHHVFSAWVAQSKSLFDKLLNEGERIAGEWMYQAHGIRYDIKSKHPFIAFDMFTPDNERLINDEFHFRIKHELPEPNLVWLSNESITAQKAMDILINIIGPIYHCQSIEEPEGVIYRVERKGKVDFLAKHVRSDFEPGKFLPEISGNDPVYNCLLDQFLDK